MQGMAGMGVSIQGVGCVWGRGGLQSRLESTPARPPTSAMCYQVRPPPTPPPGRTEAKLYPESHLSLKDLISEPVRNVLERLSAKNKIMKCVFFTSHSDAPGSLGFSGLRSLPPNLP